jgi:anti-sigma-K factor RskA
MTTHEQSADYLALYALGDPALRGKERQEIEEHLHTCAACRRELQALRADMGLLGLSSLGPQPPARSKERLMRAIAAEPPRRRSSAPVELPRRNLWWAWVPAFAAIALFFVALVMWRSKDRMKNELAELGNRNHDQSVQLDRLNRELRLLTAPDAVQVSLNPLKAPRQPGGTAIFSPSQRRMMFMASNLAPTPPGMAYELWIIPMKGAPIAAGVFKPDAHGNAMMMDHEMPPGVEAKAFAITVEKEEGSDKPTSPIMLMGETSAGG